jgi:DNA-binding FrmR family transcriptional regulator
MTEQKDNALINLKKAQSLMAKIIKMKEEKKYCIDIMQQNLAVIGLLKSANQKMMEQHLNTCFKSALLSKNSAKQQKMIKEILQVTKLSNK